MASSRVATFRWCGPGRPFRSWNSTVHIHGLPSGRAAYRQKILPTLNPIDTRLGCEERARGEITVRWRRRE
jgi:hypothetical protein